MIIYSTYFEVFMFNESILARALQCAHKFKKVSFNLKNIIFGSFRQRWMYIDIFFDSYPITMIQNGNLLYIHRSLHSQGYYRPRDYVVRVNDMFTMFISMKHFDVLVNEINVKINTFKFGDGIIEYT